MQAQAPFPPYAGLWTRLTAFDPYELGALITSGAVVRTALLRGTVHLVTADDALAIRPLVQPVLDRWIESTAAKRLAGIDPAEVADVARAVLDDGGPRTPAELARALAQRWPGTDPEDFGRVARGRLALVQLPPRAVWGKSGRTVVTTAQQWLGDRPAPRLSVDDLVRRYLRAFDRRRYSMRRSGAG